MNTLMTRPIALFDVADAQVLKPGSFNLLVGSRGSGKSTLMRDIMSKRRTIPRGIVISKSEKTMAWKGGFFRKFIPEQYIYSTWCNNRMMEIYEAQKRLVSQKGVNPSTEMFLILDDVLPIIKQIKSSEVFEEIVFNGRHANITVFMLIQDCKALDPKHRENFDNIFVFAMTNLKSQKRFFDDFGAMFSNFKEFRRIFENITDEQGVMVLKMTASSSKIDKTVFWYRANANVRDFRVGTARYWRVAEEYARTAAKVRKEDILEV